MKKITIQFHATLEEIVQFASSTCNELGLYLTKMTTKPFNVSDVSSNLDIECNDRSAALRLIFTKGKPALEVSSPNNFYDLNTDSIGLNVGLISERGLTESSLAFMSNDDEAINIAKKVASRLKKITYAGAIVVNALNGAEGKASSHRYTKAAKTMYDKGVKMRPLAGDVYFKLGN